jgi:sulfite reductase (ferredoxin)
VFYFSAGILNVQLERTGVLGAFMLRIHIPNGMLRAGQLRSIARLAERHARALAALTIHHNNVQLDGLMAESVPEILQELRQYGLTTMDACGDGTGNITGCPVVGLDAGEICDVSPLIIRAREALTENRASCDLPHKLRIAISGCQARCFHPEVTDIAFTATRRKRNGTREVGFRLRVGGQLSSESLCGVRVPAFLRPEQALFVVNSIVEIFGNSASVRHSHKGVVAPELWTAKSFLAALKEHLNLLPDADENEGAPPVEVYRDHVGIYPQKQAGRFYAGVAVPGGRLSAIQMAAAANLAERYGSGDLRITNMQNLIILNIAKHNVDPLASELETAGLSLQEAESSCGSRVCQGDEELRAMLARDEAALVGQDDFSRAVPV